MNNPLRFLRWCKLSAALAAALAFSPSAVAQDDATFIFNSGRAVFVPYYSINDGWETLMNVTNTSPHSLAVKVRLHEARNSRDVLDFIVLLSPYDVWTAWVSEGANGRPFLQTNDRSCTVPLSVRNNGVHASELAYSGQFRDHTATDGDISRMTEGYIELLVMSQTQHEGRPPDDPDGIAEVVSANSFRGDTAWFAVHENGEPRDCQIIQNDFVRRTPLWGGGVGDDVPGEDGDGVENGSGSPLAHYGATRIGNNGPNPQNAVDNEDRSRVGYGRVFMDAGGEPDEDLLQQTIAPLKVNATLVNKGKGLAAGIESLHLPIYGLDPFDVLDELDTALGLNLVAAQQFPWFLEPTLVSWRGLWTTFNNAEFAGDLSELVLLSGGLGMAVANEWTNNPALGANSDWVLTFPMKRFQSDEDAPNIQAACNIWRNSESGGGLVSATQGAIWAGWGAAPPGHMPRELDELNDNEAECPEHGFPEVFQHSNNGLANLVVRYDIFDREEGQVTFEVDGPVISPDPPPDVTIDNMPYEVNVLKIGRNAAALPSALDSQIALAIDTSVLPSNSDTGWLRVTFQAPEVEAFFGYTVTGFIFKKRDFGIPAFNFGQATEHTYGIFPELINGNGGG